MSDDVFRILNRLDMDSAEIQVSLQCAPLLTGIKISNLLHIRSNQIEEVLRLFEHSTISCHILYDWNGRVSMLLYRKDALLRYLEQDEVRETLAQFGCKTLDLDEIMDLVAKRNQAYVEERGPYPHEIGLILGYPPEDVTGFIEQRGRNYKISGYWKVYGDPIHAEKLFRAYDHARDRVIRLVGNGLGVKDIMTSYNIMKRRQLLAQI